MMDLRLLESFCGVFDAGSLQRAATELGYAQSTFTQRIQQLERDMGTALFERNGKRLIPTEQGRLLYEEAKPLLQQAAAVRTRIADAASGEAPSLRLGATEPAMVRIVPALASFRRSYPRAKLSVEFGTTSSLAQRVADGAIEFAVCAPVTVEGRVTFARLYDETLGLLLPAAHPLAKKPRITLKDLQNETLIYSEQSCKYRAYFQHAVDCAGISLKPTIEIASIGARVAAVQYGMGLAIVPEYAARPLPAKTAFRLIHATSGHIAMGIVRRADAPPASAALRALLEALTRMRFDE